MSFQRPSVKKNNFQKFNIHYFYFDQNKVNNSTIVAEQLILLNSQSESFKFILISKVNLDLKFQVIWERSSILM